MRLMGWALSVAFTLNLGWNLFLPLYSIILLGLGATPFEVGVAFFALNLTSALLRFPAGHMADRGRRVQLILLSALISIPASLLALMGGSWIWFLATLILIGAGVALYFQAEYSIVADLNPTQTTGRTYSQVHLVEGFAWLLAPFIAGIFLENKIEPFLYLTALAAFTLSLLPAQRLLKVDRIPPSLPRLEDLPQGMAQSVRRVWGVGGWLFAAEFLSGVVVGFISPTLPVYLHENFKLDLIVTGAIVTGTTISFLAAQVPGGRLSDALGKKKIYLLSNLLAVPALAVWSFAPDIFTLLFAVILYYFLRGVTFIAVDSLLATAAPLGMRALTFGVSWAMWRFGLAAGSIGAGGLWSLIGLQPLYLISSAILLGGTLLASRVVEPKGNRGKV